MFPAAKPANIIEQPKTVADLFEIRPDGIGLCGRSRRSCSTSNTSLNTIPAIYKQLDETKSNKKAPIGSSVSWVNQYPMKISAMAVNTFGNRISCSQAKVRDELDCSVVKEQN